MVRSRNSALLILATIGLQACASITSGSSQSVSISTEPVSGATCQLTNDAGSWFVNATPGSVTIHREASDLTVICKKDKLHGTARVESTTKALAFGNILAGGIIGAAVDRSNGAAFDYPTLINVPISLKGSSIVIAPPPEPESKESSEPGYRR